MAKDPVCGMEVDEKKPQRSSNTRERCITSVLVGVRKPLKRSRKSM